jgi:hypothetical protein
MADENSPESKLLKSTLGDVRKGKARNFAILAQGSEVLGLILSKKAISPGSLLDAKKAAKAKKVFTGTALGKGADVTFFSTDNIPLKPAALKVWIGENTGLKVSPEFKTIADLDTVGKAKAKDVASDPPDAKTTDTKKADTKKADDKKADAKKAPEKQPDAKKQATRKKQISTVLAALIKTRAGNLKGNDKAAALAKGAKASIDKGDLDLAEKALKALAKATKAGPKAAAKTPA